MKIFDLRCEHDHRFEGWFASAEAFADQHERGLLACPICASTMVQRLPSAPHLNLSATRAAPEPHGAVEDADAPPSRGVPTRVPEGAQPVSERAAAIARRLHANWLRAMREVIRETENVGDAFAEEARKIHYREAPERAIRGVASVDDVAALVDEGIDVVPLPFIDGAKETLQ